MSDVTLHVGTPSGHLEALGDRRGYSLLVEERVLDDLLDGIVLEPPAPAETDPDRRILRMLGSRGSKHCLSDQNSTIQAS